MITVADLGLDANPLARHYSEFAVDRKLLLTGHSHQAWPDVSREGQLLAWQDAAEHADLKWERAAAKAEAVRGGFRRLVGAPSAEIALAQNVHELVARFLSALPLRSRPKIVTSDSEFHSLRRQLQRLGEEGVEIVVVAQEPFDTLGERVAAEVDGRTCAVMVSMVFFNSGRVFRDFVPIVSAADDNGAQVLVDVYHAANVVPMDIAALALERAYIVGGGYKYCQLGEGNCFMCLPADCELRPVYTGWFAEFALLDGGPQDRVRYPDGAARFAGSTYDPTSHYRAARVFDFFDELGLDVPLLHAINRHQVDRLLAAFRGLDLPDDIAAVEMPAEERGGFLTLRSARAGELCQLLRERGVFTDSRHDRLRFGPAPYLRDDQLDEAMGTLAEAYAALP